MNNFVLRRAAIADVKSIHALLMAASGEGLLLPRPLSELYNHLREFYIVSPAGENRVLGCCALSIVWEDTAEIRSLIVSPEIRKQGFGRQLVDKCLQEAVELKIKRIFTLTYQTEFFERLGFEIISKDTLPQKIWSVCINCPKFPDCDETAMQKLLI